jgi:2'-5' RNA ligase
VAQALELFFDPATEAAIRDVWAQLEVAGVPTLASRSHRRHRPHISLAVADLIKTHDLDEAQERLANTHLDVTLHSPGIFPRAGVLYLSVMPTLELLRLHQAIHATMRDSMVAPSDLYSVGVWMPHCTLAQDLTRRQLMRGIDLLHEQPSIAAHVHSAGIFDTSTGDVLPVATLLAHR